MGMTTREKFDKVFDSGYTFSFKNKLCHRDGEWDQIITWTRFREPGDCYIASCKHDYTNIDDCLDDCLIYIENLENGNSRINQ